MPAETVQRLTTWAELLEASGRDPLVRYDAGPVLPGAWAARGAVAYLRRTPGRRSVLVLLGDDVGVELLLAAAAGDPAMGAAGEATAVTLPHHLEPLLHQRFRVGPGGDWEWLWTTAAPPPQPAESGVLTLDDGAGAAELVDLLALANPRASARPGDPGSELWVGARDASGALVACGAMQRTDGGRPHLASIAVHPDRRGEGLGAAVTAGLTRRAVAADGVCTLGMYSDNAVARLLYLRLGYRVAHAWATRVIHPLPSR